MEETSKKVRHTESPWKVKTSKEPLHPTTYAIKNFDGLHIADVNIGMFDAEANAQLIAAAPSLLEALESVVSAFDISNEKYADWTGTHELYDAIIKVKQAIKLAKGNGES